MKKSKKGNRNKPKLKTVKKPDSKTVKTTGFLETMWNKNFKLSAILLICILGFLAYSNTFQAEMQFDDGLQIVSKDDVKDLSHFASFSQWVQINKRPLAFFSFALNYAIGEYNVGGYHLFNLVIHLLSAIVVFFLARFIYGAPSGNNILSKPDYANIAALFTALLFVAHPIQTQAITYIVQRMTSQSAMFYLLAVLLYALGRRRQISGNKRNAILFYIATLIAAVCSLLTKQIAATIPFALLLYEFFFVRNKDGKTCLRYIIISLSLLLAGVTFVLFAGILPAETEDISRYNYLVTQSRVIVKYFQLLILPIQQNVDYSFPLSETIWGWKELLSISLLMGILGLAIFLVKKKPVVSFGIFWIFLTLSIESSIIPIQDVIFEHRLYLPMFGFALIVTDLVLNFFGRKKIKPAVIALSILVILLSFTTYSRNQVWRTQYALWKDIVEKSPDKVRPLHNLVNLYDDDGRHAEAIPYAKKAVQLDPSDGHTYYVLAVCNERAGNIDQAIHFYSKGIKAEKISKESMNNLGLIYLNRNEYHEAIKYFKMVLKHDKKAAVVLKNLVVAYAKLKDPNNTIKYAKKYLQQVPDDVAVLSYLGDSYLNLKKTDKAIKTYEKVIGINPGKVSTYNNLGTCYFYDANYKRAAYYYSEALMIDPGNKNAKQYLSLTRKYLKE